MKKRVFFLLFSLLVFCVACGDEKNVPDNTAKEIASSQTPLLASESSSAVESSLSNEEALESSSAETVPVVKVSATSNGYPIISKEEFLSYVTTVELTTDNWLDYIELNEKEIKTYNAFGEVSETEILYQWETKNGITVQFGHDIAIELQNTKESYTRVMGAQGCNWLGLGSKGKTTDFECIRAKGTLYVINVPDEKWINHDALLDIEWDPLFGNPNELMCDQVLYVGTSDKYFVCDKNGRIFYNNSYWSIDEEDELAASLKHF